VKRLQSTELYIALICGDRNFREEYSRVVKREIAKLVKKHGTRNLVILEGGAPGVDELAYNAAKRANVHAIQVDALWNTRHSSAGPQRNRIMILLRPNEVIGIHSNFTESVGTKGMLDLAQRMGIPWRLVTPR
jgi:predicted Rossmann-fold nucleotide-binding protein